MAVKTEGQLGTDKEVIRTETVKGANTANRVGSMFGDIIDTLFAVFGKIKTISLNGGTPIEPDGSGNVNLTVEDGSSLPAQDGTTIDKALFSTGTEGAEEWREVEIPPSLPSQSELTEDKALFSTGTEGEEEWREIEIPPSLPAQDGTTIDKALFSTGTEGEEEWREVEIPPSLPEQDETTDGKALFSTGVEGEEIWKDARSLLAWEDTYSIQPVATFNVLVDIAGTITKVRRHPDITDLKIQINGGAQNTLTFTSHVWNGSIAYPAGATITYIPTSSTASALFVVKGEDN
jgi:hypothetical protein